MAEKGRLRVKATDMGFEFWLPDLVRGRFLMDTKEERLSLVVHKGRREVVSARADLGAIDFSGVLENMDHDALREYLLGLVNALKAKAQSVAPAAPRAAVSPEQLERIRRAHDAANSAYAKTLITEVKKAKGQDLEAIHLEASRKAAGAGQAAYDAVTSEAGAPVAAAPVNPS